MKAGAAIPSNVSKVKMQNRPLLVFSAMFLFCVVATSLPARASDGDVTDEYQFTVSPHHAVHGDLTGFGELGYYRNPTADYRTYTVQYPGVVYKAARWAQFTGSFRVLYTDYETGANKLELRPSVGAKLFLPNDIEWNIYNYTRIEYRDMENRNTEAWSHYTRTRSRFAMEIPLASRATAWKPNTWYALADVEPFYRFDRDTVDPLRFRAGIARILSDGVHVELTYDAQFARASDGSPLELSENIFNLNVKIGLQEGLLRRIQNPGRGR